MSGLPGVCRGCHLPVVYLRGSWRDPFARGMGMPHVCGADAVPVAPNRVCGKWMPNAKERCARRPGHAPTHRTRYAMDCDRAARSGRVA